MVKAELLPISWASNLIDDWRSLAERAAEPNPFHEPAFVLPAARHLNLPPPYLLVVRDGPRLVALLPVRRAYRFRQLPVPVLQIWRHPYWGLGTPLVDRDAIPEATSALVDMLARQANRRLVLLEWQGTNGPVEAAMAVAFRRSSLKPVPLKSFPRATIGLGSSRAEGDPVSARRRREFRRLRRLLDEAAGVATEVRERSDAGGVEAFLRLEASGWKGRKGTALASRNGHAGFFREMCGEFERMGRLRVLSLEAEGRPVAMKCTVSAGDGLFYLKAAYDETFARFSPGLQLEREAVERFLADRSAGGPSWIDSCTDPANDMINRLLPDRRDLTTYVVPPKGTLARAVISGMAGVGRRSGGVRSA